GWNDVSLHGSDQIMTPNIDIIGHKGIVIQNYYTDTQGTPSRSAMLTGKYPMRMGTQGESIGGAEDRGVPVSEKLLPSYLKDLGYATHLVGKWQLGKSRECFLPTYRGFDTFYGFLGSSIDYYTYNRVEVNMLNNTLIIFVSDNGAAATGMNENFGSNVPLRGTKGTPWEGAVRSTALIWHNRMRSHVWKGLFHVTDWMPTLISAAKGKITDPIDGIDQWHAMINDEEALRTEMIIAVDDLKGWGALRDGEFKIVIGNIEQCCSEYYGEELSKLRNEEPLYEKALLDSETATVFREVLNTTLNINKAFKKRSLCIISKPKNKINNTQLCMPTNELTLRFRNLWLEIQPRRPPSFDIRANPSFHDYIWYPWLDGDEPVPVPLTNTPRYPLQVSTEEFNYYVETKLKIMKESLNDCVKSLTDKFVDGMSRLF
ncbi:Arylsulfatase B, partial [Operophtera brumata]